MSILNKIAKFPSEPGIYLFYNKKKELIYVGKATNLRARVRSYFRNPPQPSLINQRIDPSFGGKRGGGLRPIEAMIDEVFDIKIKQTDSVLEAIILEANTIKKYQPKYNVDLKDDKSWNYICITKDEYPRVKTVRAHEIESQKSIKSKVHKVKEMFGPYPGLNTKATMKLLQRLFYISTCKSKKQRDPSTRLRLTQDDERPCLYRQMGQCLGVCTGEITSAEYKKKVINPLIKFLRGNKKGLIRDLEKKMKLESKQENFEEAGRLRNQVKALERIHDIALLNKDFVVVEAQNFAPVHHKIQRIEGYDISNLGDTGKVGSMVVFENGYPNKSQYRKFKIKTVIGQSDVDCLAEVLERRLKHAIKNTDDADHADNYFWSVPDVILVDGGVPQVNKVVEIIRINKFKIPILGIAKGPERKKNELILGFKDKDFIKWVSQNQNLLIQVRDEAHRFVIRYQRSLRKIKH